MIQIQNKQDCCGCTACASICPRDAISMVPDVMGFLYPKVDVGKCIECKLCERVCAFNEDYHNHLHNLSEPLAYGARHRNMREVETSRSGAAFIAISDVILKMGGVVYGAGYDEHFRVIHKRATASIERDEFKGSKYVQSDLTGIFRQIKKDLESGFPVLFSGTPCQTAGLNSYIGAKLRPNLYLLDIVCHGVPSPYIWRDYLDYIEKEQGDRVCYVNFRDKEYGWNKHIETFKFLNGTQKVNFKFQFYKLITFRYSCANCHYTNLHRPSDITIADFWGWEQANPDSNKDNKGISLLLVNTEKGKYLLEKAIPDLTIFSVNLENCKQPNLEHPTQMHPARDKFEKLYARKGFLAAMKKYGDLGWRYKLMKPLMSLLGNETKLRLKKLLYRI